MKDFAQYKRMVKFLFSALIVSLETMVYGYVWINYYNEILDFPFWRRGNWLIIVLYAMLLCFFSYTYGGFKVGFFRRWNVIYSQILSLFFTNLITYMQIALIDKKFHSVAIIGAVFGIQIAIAVIWAFICQFLYAKMYPQRSLLLIYGDRPTYQLMQKIGTREDRFQITNIIHYKQSEEVFEELVDRYDGIIIGDIPAHERNQLLKLCFGKKIRTYTSPKISDIINLSSEYMNMFDTPLLLSRNEGLQVEQLFLKRITDIVVSAIGLVMTAPFFLVIAIMIKTTDRGPVFYKQTRLTKDRQEFEIYKFRTMIMDAEKDGKARLASKNDDRILPVGKFLRATRLDELPQLINILKGERSLVGPRPERPELAVNIEEELPEFACRLKVKAGLTGYAQIYGKYNTTSYDKLKLDLTYIRNYSYFLDWKLMLMTPKIMLLKESTEGVGSEEDIIRQQQIAAARIEIQPVEEMAAAEMPEAVEMAAAKEIQPSEEENK